MCDTAQLYYALAWARLSQSRSYEKAALSQGERLIAAIGLKLDSRLLPRGLSHSVKKIVLKLAEANPKISIPLSCLQQAENILYS